MNILEYLGKFREVHRETSARIDGTQKLFVSSIKLGTAMLHFARGIV